MFNQDVARSRWARTDRFALSAEGEGAEVAYRQAIVASREEAGRSSYDAARAEWARTLSLQPDDGVYLGELRGGPSKLSEVIEALDTCGKTKKEALEAFGRLVDGGLVLVQSQGREEPPSSGWEPFR